MDRVYPESSEDNDFTDHTMKRRISSILKAPRTPLRELENGKELTQDKKVEKPQKNSRRVSFADTISVYPSESQTLLKLDHAERAADARDQAALYQNEDLKVEQCEITEMNTLLHAPIQTSLEETECHQANTGREWNKMDRTLIFSEENEMDMTAGHTIMIIREIGMSQSDKPRKEDFILSDELKSNKEAPELKECSFFSNPTKLKETCTSPQKTHMENTKKIKFDDFLKSLKSTKLCSVPAVTGPFISSEVLERSMYYSEENAYFHSQKEKYNPADAFCRQENRTAVEEDCIYNRKVPAAPTKNPKGCEEVTLTSENQSTNMVIANTGWILPSETSSLNKVNQQENVRRDCPLTYSTNTRGLKTSNDVQQDPHMCTVNSKGVGIAENQSVIVTKSSASLASHQGKSTVSVPFESGTSVPVFSVDKTTIFSDFCADMDITGNFTGLIWNENSNHSGNHHGMSEKQRNVIPKLMEETAVEENNMDITNNQTSCLNNMPYSVPYNEMSATHQKFEFGNTGLLNPRLHSDTWESSFHERKENSLPVSLSRERSAAFSSKDIDLNRNVAKSNIRQGKSQFLPLYNSVGSFNQITSVESKINRESGILDNATSLIPSEKTVYYEDMEITKPTTHLMKTAQFRGMPQQEMRTGKKSAACLDNDKTVVFSLSGNNEMEITKSYTVAVNNDIPQLEQIPQMFSLQHVNKTVYPCYKDTDPSLQNIGAQAVQKLDNEAGGRTLTGSPKDKTVVFSLNNENEMEITKSHTAALNQNIPQHQGIPNSSVVPMDKTVMFSFGDDMEITKPAACATAKYLKNISGFFKRPMGSAADKTSHSEGNEIELTKSLTVELARVPQAPSSVPTGQTSMSIIGSNMIPDKSTTCVPVDRPVTFMHSDDMEITKSIMHMSNTSPENTGFKTLVKPGKHVEWEPISNQVFDDKKTIDKPDSRKTVKSHLVSSDSKTDLNNQPAIQAGFSFSLNKLGAFESFQNNKKVADMPFNTIGNENLVRSEMKMSSKSILESMDNMRTSTCELKTKDAIYDSNDNVSNAEKLIPNSAMILGENIPFLDESVEITKNYTTGIELMHTNAIKNEKKMNSDFPTSADSYGLKLGVDKCISEQSVCSAKVIPSVSQTIVQEQQRALKSHTEPYTSSHNNPNGLYHSAKKSLVWTEEIQGQNSKLTQEMTEKECMFAPENESLENDPGKLSQLRQEGNCTEGKESNPVVDKETKNYNTSSCEQGSITKDRQTNVSPSLQEKPQLSGIVSDCSKLNDIRNKPEINTESIPGEQLPKLMMKPEAMKENIKESNSSSNDMTNTNIMEDAPYVIGQNHCQMTKLPLGIFPPKLPNRRKSAIPRLEEVCAALEERPEIQDSENTLLIKKPSVEITHNLSPSHYIDEELLPACIEEMDSNESLNSEELQKPHIVVNEKEIITREEDLSEIAKTNRQKRAWNQENEELQKEKKLKIDKGWNDTTEAKEPLSSSVVPHSDAEAHEDKNVPELRTTNLERTQSSTSSLDSIKADLITTDFSIQQNSELEAQLFMDSICEQNLHEKLQEGVITVHEFFTLLQVHVVIQKPRQSQLPPTYAVNAAPTPESTILGQYVYRPKLQVYDEDCQILSDTIEKLKQHVGDQDKLLVNVNKSLWEVMKTCSDEELKSFGAELNKMKSCFTKKSKVLAHRGKAKLYAKLVENAQFQWEKFQSNLAKVDELLKEMDSFLVALETETAKLESSELDLGDSLAEFKSKLEDTESELKSYKAQEEALQREQSNVREQTQQKISEITHLQEKVESCEELMKQYNFSEWVMKEWDDHQAVFTFLYDSIELTVALESPGDDATFSSKICRKVVGMNFESLLDESKAPPSSKLVQRLIFQFINSQKSRQEKCSTVHNLCQILRDISLVVSRCELLGREIDFLDRWGGKFNLQKIEVNDATVKLLFSSFIAFAKFEVELSLSASYPASPVAFTIPKCTGKLGQEDISAVLSSVPVGNNYLKRMVKQIHHNLLQCPSTAKGKDNSAVVSGINHSASGTHSNNC